MSLPKLRDLVQGASDVLRDLLPCAHPFTEDTLPSMEGCVFIVTGASSGIGVYTAQLLVSAGAKVYMFGRTPERLDGAVAKISELYPKNAPVGILVDFNDLSTIRPAVEKFLKQENRLDGIVHNAGMNWPGKDTILDTGYTDVLTVNVLAPQLFQWAVDDILRRTASQSASNSIRVVFVASQAHQLAPEFGGVNWDDINKVHNGRLGWGIYGQSKALNIYQARLWAKEYANDNIIVVAVHPGMVLSDIRRYIPTRQTILHAICKDTIWGAYAEVWPFVAPLRARDSGTYYLPYGRHGRVRHDVDEAIDSPRGIKAWNWMEEAIEKYKPSGKAAEAPQVKLEREEKKEEKEEEDKTKKKDKSKKEDENKGQKQSQSQSSASRETKSDLSQEAKSSTSKSHQTTSDEFHDAIPPQDSKPSQGSSNPPSGSKSGPDTGTETKNTPISKPKAASSSTSSKASKSRK